MEFILSILRNISSTFWSEHVWLPPNTTWTDLKPDSNASITYTNYRHLVYPIPMAFCLLAARFVLEKFIYAPVGRKLGIRNTRTKRAATVPLLEKVYRKNKHPSHRQIVGLTKQLDLSERQIERWLRIRRSQDKPSLLTKFCENAWRCCYYTFSFSYGIWVLWDKPWLWDINYCWYGYPHQGVTNDIWWYYMISMSFYWSLCFSQFWDVKRKDFWQMFIHHIAAITLMVLSWLCNLHRIGTLVLVVHDCADILLEMAKMLKYMGWQTSCDCVFGIFTILWIVTRIGIYPFWIIRSTSIEAPKILPMFPAYYIFNSLLLVLQGLHIAWTILILRIAIRALRAGQMEGDIRSSSSTEASISPELLADPTVTTTVPDVVETGHKTELVKDVNVEIVDVVEVEVVEVENVSIEENTEDSNHTNVRSSIQSSSDDETNQQSKLSPQSNQSENDGVQKPNINANEIQHNQISNDIQNQIENHGTITKMNSTTTLPNSNNPF